MPKLPSITADEVIKALKKVGFEISTMLLFYTRINLYKN